MHQVALVSCKRNIEESPLQQIEGAQAEFHPNAFSLFRSSTFWWPCVKCSRIIVTINQTDRDNGFKSEAVNSFHKTNLLSTFYWNGRMSGVMSAV